MLINSYELFMLINIPIIFKTDKYISRIVYNCDKYVNKYFKFIVC